MDSAASAGDVTEETTAVTEPIYETGGSLHGFLADESSRHLDTEDQRNAMVSQDALYARPFVASLRSARSRTAIGGYLEANSNYFVEDGVSEGFSMEFRRFNLFVYSSIADKIKFMSELEFEHGTEEIALETAQIDFAIDAAIGIKAGIILPPIGRFNVNHDAPLYDFVERPLVSTHIVPGTLSEVGAGLYGKFFPSNFTLTYDAYIVNGLGAGILFNEEGRTFIPAGKSEGMFEEDNNGRPSYSTRIAMMNEHIGEFGLSYYGGIYNDFKIEGEQVAQKLRLSLAAFDFDTSIYGLTIQGEVVWAAIDIPDDLRELFGHRQYGFNVDFVYPVYSFDWIRDAESVVNVVTRVERIDYNYGDFDTGNAAGDTIFDEETSLVLGLGFRPVPDTVIRLNYRRHWIRDFLGNPAANKSGLQVGVASYF